MPSYAKSLNTRQHDRQATGAALHKYPRESDAGEPGAVPNPTRANHAPRPHADEVA